MTLPRYQINTALLDNWELQNKINARVAKFRKWGPPDIDIMIELARAYERGSRLPIKRCEKPGRSIYAKTPDACDFWTGKCERDETPADQQKRWSREYYQRKKLKAKRMSLPRVKLIHDH